MMRPSRPRGNLFFPLSFFSFAKILAISFLDAIIANSLSFFLLSVDFTGLPPFSLAVAVCAVDSVVVESGGGRSQKQYRLQFRRH